MTGDVMCTNGQFRLALNFVEVDSSDFGVRIHLEIEYVGKHQNFKFCAEHLWVEYSELRRFESELLEGKEIILHDMSDYPVLHFQRDSSHERLTINPPSARQSADGDAIVTYLKIANGSINALYSSLNQFAKWWQG